MRHGTAVSIPAALLVVKKRSAFAFEWPVTRSKARAPLGDATPFGVVSQFLNVLRSVYVVTGSLLSCALIALSKSFSLLNGVGVCGCRT